MAETVKVTKKEYFKRIIAILENLNEVELVGVMGHELELLERKTAKRSTKPTARQIENAQIKEDILSILEENRKYTITEIMSLLTIKGMTNQRMSRICRDMAKFDGTLERIKDKQKTYYVLVG